MSRFSHFLAVDWSGAKGPRQKGIALAVALAEGGPPMLVTPPDPKGWARADVAALLLDLPGATLVGLDLGLSLPFQDAGAFFADKTISFIVASGPGGGYDMYARMLTRHYGRHIPGNPSFAVQYLPGPDATMKLIVLSAKKPPAS